MTYFLDMGRKFANGIVVTPVTQENLPFLFVFKNFICQASSLHGIRSPSPR